jgi:hypothetical protein
VPTVPLTLHPAAEPQPALRYTLVPDLAELDPGNAATVYHRVLGGEVNFLMQPGVYQQVTAWRTTPAKDLPRAEVRSLLGGRLLRELDLASRQSYCDWEFLNKLRHGGFSTLLGEIQKLRQIPEWLGARARLEMADGKPEEAIETIKTILALAHHLEEHPSVISNLVGVAVAVIGLQQVEELVQQPGCPNLYWALTNLPEPLVGFRKGVQSEKLMLQVEFEGLLKNADEPLSVAQVNRCIEKLDRLRADGYHGQNVPPPAPVRQLLESLVGTELPAARKHLTGRGYSAAHVESLPPFQVILLYELFLQQKAFDDAIKLMPLPYWQARPDLKEFGKLLDERDHGKARNLFAALWADPDKLRRAQCRLERRIAVLRVIEAVRLYAAAHDGRLPPALKDLTVPVPTDPMTGRDFEYRVDGGKAVLAGDPPPGEMPNPAIAFRYELTIQK